MIHLALLQFIIFLASYHTIINMEQVSLIEILILKLQSLEIKYMRIQNFYQKNIIHPHPNIVPLDI